MFLHSKRPLEPSIRSLYIHLLDKPENVHSLGFVLGCMQIEEIQKKAEVKLLKLLPMLQATDRLLFTSKHKSQLINLLGSRNHNVVIAVLQAIEKIGDQKDIPRLRSIINSYVQSSDGHIFEAAKTCLCTLEARKELEDWLTIE